MCEHGGLGMPRLQFGTRILKCMHVYYPHAEKAAYDGQPVIGEQHIEMLNVLKL